MIYAALAIIATILFLIACYRAPAGWEAADGFHLGDEPSREGDAPLAIGGGSDFISNHANGDKL